MTDRAIEFVARRLWREENPLEYYEDLAGRFHREHHRMAPGKSEPLEMGGRSDEYVAETRQMWNAFLARVRSEGLAEMRAIVGENKVESCQYGFCRSCAKCCADEDES